LSGLWAVTCYFNPMRYARRLANYREFRARLGAPLLAVELGYDGRFDLGDGDADAVLRLPGTDVMWQKERLLNVAIAALPPECAKVAWLDCDVVFPRAGWDERAARLLDRVPLAQLFRHARYLGRDGDVARARPSLVSGVADGASPEECLRHPSPDARPGTYSCGLAWAARRALLAEHGLYDANIIGGGDRAIACAAYGCFGHEVEWHSLTPAQERHYRAWAASLHDAVAGAVGFLDEDLHHLWHGEVRDRAFGARHEGLARFGFDPHADIAVDAHGCWRWSSDKPDLHRYVRDYFAARAEDGRS
jgi:hypothetical protein